MSAPIDAAIPPAIVEPAAPQAPAAPPAPPVSDPLTTLKHELEQTRAALANLTRDRQIARELFAHGALDLDIAAVVAERELADNPNTPIPALIANLKRRKPTLFRRPGGLDSLRLPATPPASAMGAHPAPTDSDRDRAAKAAGATNSRTALLTYLRLRRQPAD